MEPTSEVRKVTVEDARAKGLERINKLLNFVAPVFAPEKLAAAGIDAAKEKWEKSEKKKQLDSFAEKAGKAIKRWGRRWEELNDRVDARTDEMAKRAVLLGLKPVVMGESAVKWIVSDLLEIRENFADKYVYAPAEADWKERLKKATETREKSKERVRGYRQRGKEINVVHGLAEKIQTKG